MPSFAFTVSLGSAIHSLRKPCSPNRATSCDKPASASASDHEAFFATLNDLLLRLNHPHSTFLTIPWLCDALDVALRTFSSGFALVAPPHKDAPPLLQISLDDTAMLLDVCNVLKESLRHLHHYLTRVRYAALCVDAIRSFQEPLDEVNLNRAKDALSRSMRFMVFREEEGGAQKHARPELETCSSLLRISGGLQDSYFLDSAKGASGFDAIKAAKVVIVFVCSVLSSAISMRPRRCLDVAPAAVDSRPWASTLLKLEHAVNEEVERRQSLGSIVLLEEEDKINKNVEKLFSMLSSAAEQRLWPQGFSSGASCPGRSVVQSALDLQQGVASLEHKTDDLFRRVVATRADFLGALCNGEDFLDC